ncbi:MAG: hypothetical protein ACJ8FF_02525 [Sphingomicrobium sp.]
MTPLAMIEVAAAALILGGAIWLYRRKPAGVDASGGYGSQGAVLLLVIAVIVAIHGLGGMNYHPSASEREMYEGMKGMTGH